MEDSARRIQGDESTANPTILRISYEFVQMDFTGNSAGPMPAESEF
jgi:hypothetical protein